MTTSAEYRVLVQNYDVIFTEIQGEMTKLATKARAKLLLSDGDQSKCTHMVYTSEQKANFFMQAISKKISVNPSLFYKLIEIMKSEPALHHVATKLGKT